jgi:glucan endo-1,3-alpha-glucosidase
MTFVKSGLFAANQPSHYVFANYMVCFATYGGTVDGFKREITEAQNVGIDGFFLDIGQWSGPDTYYKERVQMIYNAAEQLNTGFKLSFFIEFSNTNDILNMVQTYGNRTPTFWYQGRMVFSAWGMNDVPSAGWTGVNWTNILNLLKGAGYPAFFIPHFWPDPFSELPSYTDAQGLLAKYSFLDGLYLFCPGGQPAQMAQSNSNYCRALHAAGKTFLACVAPNYWGWAQPSNGRRYFETYGGEGISLQWTSIITNQPDWAIFVTWNDFNESTYVSPVEDPGTYFWQLVAPVRNSHKGYLQLSKHYISWFKTGQEPPIDRDALFYFYRTHPKSAVAANTNDLRVTTFFGDVQDVLYTTLLLVKPADLEILSGGNWRTNSLPSGIQHIRTPFTPGAQRFTIRRGGVEVLSVSGPSIQSNIDLYDFFPASGYAYGGSGPPMPPQNIRLSGPP